MCQRSKLPSNGTRKRSEKLPFLLLPGFSTSCESSAFATLGKSETDGAIGESVMTLCTATLHC